MAPESSKCILGWGVVHTRAAAERAFVNLIDFGPSAQPRVTNIYLLEMVNSLLYSIYE